MTSPGSALPRDLAARLFRALYTGYDLHATGGIHVAVPKGHFVVRRAQPQRDRLPAQRRLAARPGP